MHRLHRERLVGESGKPPPLPGVDRADSDQTLARFSRLPAEQREVLALVVLEGLLYTEIADVLDVPVGTVMSRLHRAREGMRAMTPDSEAPRPGGK
jgi:RNA polymerase sigma-70 factor, ECF subfamily